ncbi:unnamed protein product [Brassica oleracea var. botrytis]|uniref:(rape) hypothetical protein n=1 Tax=Brassica napus TaxID=3708 RepID=A0A078FEQ3_BRANA|nr:unnamed protein product [Brassica napus]CDY11751.1 BnaC03g58270D [Brassica napus]
MKSKQRKMTKQTQTNETGTEQEGPTSGSKGVARRNLIEDITSRAIIVATVPTS